MDEETKGAILYELICCSEWQDEKEDHVPLKNVPEKCSSVISQISPAAFLRSKPTIHDSVTSIVSLGPPWSFAVTSDGKIMAILQASFVETRSDRDNFSSSFGRSSIPTDLYPNFRCMAWNQDGSLLAVSFTNGQISFYDLMATPIFNIRLFPLPSVEETVPYSIDNALSGLFFVEERVKKATFPNELLTVDRRGNIKSFRQVTADRMELHHDSSFRRYYPSGTTAVVYSVSSSLILVSGAFDVGNEMVKRKEQSLKNGITAWRLLNDHPYYRIVLSIPQQEFRMDSRNLWRLAYTAISAKSEAAEDSIFRIRISPNNKLIAAAHTSGTISIWQFPSLKLHQHWPLKSQFQYNAENPTFNCNWRVALNRSRSKPIDPWRFHVFDINWWNNQVVIISRVNGCVSLCSVHDHVPSRNLLGDSPEHFESGVTVSNRFNKGFFAFEGDLKIKGSDDTKDLSSSDLELVLSEFWLTTLYQEILFWITDSERFRPPRKRKRKPPTWINTHRLFNVRSITPLELFHRKIDAEEYGEALDLAKAFNLDSDLVFQRRWTKQPVTVRTIKDYLAKITKRNWVLQECLDRVPDNVDAARKLLEFGLKGTDLTAAVTISQGRDKGHFIMWAPDDLDISESEYLSLIDKDNEEVQRLIGYRKQYLHFLDMLNTYEMILGGPHLAEENFDPKVFTKLRNNTVLESCIDMARNSDISGLKIMFTNHWSDVSSFYLHILSSFPETTTPHIYRDFLPELSNRGEVLLWDEFSSKEKDWSDGCPFTFIDTNRILPEAESHTADFIYQWFDVRVREIELFTGLTNLALDLAKLGVERNVVKLKTLVENLETVEVLVYELCNDDMSLDKLERLTNIEKLELLMKSSKDDSFVGHFKLYALPFLNQCERRDPGTKFELLNKYLTKISENDLSLPLTIFEHSKREATDPIISDVCDLMKLAYNCIYACKNSKQSGNILSLLGCLPDRGYGGHIPEGSELEKLHDAIDELELHYNAVQILEKYNLPYSLKEIQTMIDNQEEIEAFFIKLCQCANKKNPPMKVNEWKTLLYDILELHKKLFTKYEVKKCYMSYVNTVLKSGSSEVINLARNFLDQTPTEVETDDSGELKITRRNSTAYSTQYALYLYLIPYEESLGMVLDSCELYFDSASNYSDPDMELAKTCLNLMQNTKEPSITYMFDLIDAVKVLNKDFNMHILPQSVRRCQDKMGLLRKSMENISDGYRKIQQLLKLALFLRIDDKEQEEVESCVFEMAGDTGIKNYDIKFCTQICHNIMAKGYHAGWKIFTHVAQFQSDPPMLDSDTRLAFINYALHICPSDEIFEVLNAKYMIEIRMLQAHLTEMSPSDSATETAMLESQEEDSFVLDKLDKTKFEGFVQTATSWINPLKKVAEVVKSRGDALLHVSRVGQIGAHLTSRVPLPLEEDHGSSNENFLQESYPTFYITEEEVPHVHQSLFAYKYDTFSKSSVSTYIKSNPALELCLTINRIWHLEKLLLGSGDTGERDYKVLEQLVGEILPEDIPWGFAILSSIGDITTLSKVLQSVPQTRVSKKVILVYLCYRIYKELMITKTEEDLAVDNLNKLIEQTTALVESEDFLENNEDENLRNLISVFFQFKDDSLVDTPFEVNSDEPDHVDKHEEIEGKEEEEEEEEDYQAGDGWED